MSYNPFVLYRTTPKVTRDPAPNNTPPPPRKFRTTRPLKTFVVGPELPAGTEIEVIGRFALQGRIRAEGKSYLVELEDLDAATPKF